MSKYIKLEDAIKAIGETAYFKEDRQIVEDGARAAFEELDTIEVSEDCISREYLRSKVYDADDDDLVVDWDDIAAAPSVIPRPHDTQRRRMLICPNCGLDVHSDFCRCPRCGADIKDTNEVSEDCISRERLLEMYKYMGEDDTLPIATIVDDILNAPSVIPSRPKGE